MPIKRVGFLGVGFDQVTMQEVLSQLASAEAGAPFRYVVTPNVDHVVRLDNPGEAADLIAVYNRANLSVCDSRVLRQLAKAHGLDLPLVPGSDLTVQLFEKIIRPGDRIAVVGGSRELLCDLQRRYPELNLLHFEPPMGLRRDANARQKAADFIVEARARFIFLAVGSPQQEMIAFLASCNPQASGTALCIGASLDFITGRQRRAPRAVQKLGLEWAFRLGSNPRRLWRRYLVEGPRIFLLAARFRAGHPRP